MGCIICKFKFFHSEPQSEELVPKEYSWDKRKDVDLEFFMAQNLVNELVIRKPGTINGQQFVIQNCKSCKIIVLDCTATVTIDECIDCFILLGPVKSSVFLRDSSDCKLAASCQQFRSRDCKRIELFLHCTTKPIIEASVNMKFTCLQCYYPELRAQLETTGLSTFNNNWSDIHDFTPVPGEKNYSFLPNGVTFGDQVIDLKQFNLSVDPMQSCVPLTHGKRAKLFGETCMVIFFKEEHQIERVQTFLRLIYHDSCILVQTKEIHLSLYEAERLFGKTNFSDLAIKGNLISLEINGTDACKVCMEKASHVTDSGDTAASMFVSTSYDAHKLLNIFYGLAQAQTSV